MEHFGGVISVTHEKEITVVDAKVQIVMDPIHRWKAHFCPISLDGTEYKFLLLLVQNNATVLRKDNFLQMLSLPKFFTKGKPWFNLAYLC